MDESVLYVSPFPCLVDATVPSTLNTCLKKKKNSEHRSFTWSATAPRRCLPGAQGWRGAPYSATRRHPARPPPLAAPPRRRRGTRPRLKSHAFFFAELSKRSCVSCNSKDLQAMSEDSAKTLLEQVAGWEMKNEGGILKLHRAWKVKNFAKGLEFFQLVAAVAEEEGHHPDLHLVGWNNVKIDVWTHSVSGLTDNDFILAAKINELKLGELLSKKKATAQE
ncbi:pterin-4-alpha-carbinolamine dehydratase 2, mitochondrial-like isoform X2 [Triticum urartu]|uniref:pterin-4-alpha-carbinolamine dehydratase 2, mitochondrial-like isoform X2 n=1 Tax=Triticum urartu TaxID=4572 RepID=UPI002044129E|nr:pterin-4-alpha-carbinolamine dehydratase 2, mitochondrial-like isoform X2 [Triticum urartu]